MTNQPTEVFRSEWREPEAAQRQPKGPRRFPWLLGAIGVAIAIAAAVVQVIGIVQASALHWELGTLLAWVAILLDVIAFLVGLAAVILNRGRRWGVVAMVLGVITNPAVLVLLFRLLG